MNATVVHLMLAAGIADALYDQICVFGNIPGR